MPCFGLSKTLSMSSICLFKFTKCPKKGSKLIVNIGGSKSYYFYIEVLKISFLILP